MNGLLHNDEKDPRKKFFHHESVSVPIDVPTRPGVVHKYDIPFGPPVIHAEPEKTMEITFLAQKQYQQQQQQQNSQNNGFFFNIGGPSIVPDGFRFECEEDNNDNVRMTEE